MTVPVVHHGTMVCSGVERAAPGPGHFVLTEEWVSGEARLLAKGEIERGRSQRLDAVWSGEPSGICKAHPKKGAVFLEA